MPRSTFNKILLQGQALICHLKCTLIHDLLRQNECYVRAG